MQERTERPDREQYVLAPARSGLSKRRSMMTTAHRYSQFHAADDGPSLDPNNTLVPMLIGGLGLIVVGMIAVGLFVG